MDILLKLFLTFLKLGFIMFGGGYGLLSMLLTEAEGLGVTLEQFADLTALDLIVPGPIAVNSATYIGYLGGGVPGAFAATLGVIIPSYIICLLALYSLDRFRENTLMQGVLSGVKPAAVGMVCAAVVTIGVEVLLQNGYTSADLLFAPLLAISPLAAVIFAATAVLNIRFKVSPILLTVCAGLLGALFL